MALCVFTLPLIGAIVAVELKNIHLKIPATLPQSLCLFHP
jgi:hypothetical protein